MRRDLWLLGLGLLAFIGGMVAYWGSKTPPLHLRHEADGSLFYTGGHADAPLRLVVRASHKRAPHDLPVMLYHILAQAGVEMSLEATVAATPPDTPLPEGTTHLIWLGELSDLPKGLALAKSHSAVQLIINMPAPLPWETGKVDDLAKAVVAQSGQWRISYDALNWRRVSERTELPELPSLSEGEQVTVAGAFVTSLSLAQAFLPDKDLRGGIWRPAGMTGWQAQHLRLLALQDIRQKATK